MQEDPQNLNLMSLIFLRFSEKIRAPPALYFEKSSAVRGTRKRRQRIMEIIFNRNSWINFISAVDGLKKRCIMSGYDKEMVENIIS